MKKLYFSLCALIVSLAAISGGASAGVVDFEDFVVQIGAPRPLIIDKGLTFSGTNMDVYGPYVGGFFVPNGTFWLHTNHYFITTITATSGADFSMSQLDMELTSLFDLQAQEYATLVGHRADGLTVTTDILVSASGWNTFILSGFNNLTSLDIFKRELGEGSLGFDNLVFNEQAIPEPGSIFLLALGLFGLSAARRRQR
ncbi:PEP-CTERM sorting domain-containing protein [Massilia sp. S19_KUP03_FR1]|uniref:PEP-CTERM sorting domain-containing protein n=1 Tax=Massilia sp. S19_KUP03_FR1 TaxID=3025503 RepID=UPI002FCDD1B9